jgi:hypothetical protein
MFPYHAIHIVTYWATARQRPQHTCGQQYRSSVFCGPCMDRCYAAHVLGSVEIAHCKKRHTRAHLGFRWRTISNSSNGSPWEQSEGRANPTTWWTVRRLLANQQTLNKVQQRYYWLKHEGILKNGADSVTLVQLVAAPGPGIKAKCTSTVLGPRLKG